MSDEIKRKPLWYMLWWGFRWGLTCVSIAWECCAPFGQQTRRVEGKWYRQSGWENFWWLLLASPIILVKTVALHLHDRRWMPWAVVGAFCDAEYWIMDRMEAHNVYFDWCEPRPDLAPPGFTPIGHWQRKGASCSVEGISMQVVTEG